MRVAFPLTIVIGLGGISESDRVMGDIQQTLKRINLPYSDGLYDWQSDLQIIKNKDRETIGSRSLKGISLRAFTDNGWVYSDSNKTDLPTIRRLTQSFNKGRPDAKARSKLSLPEPIKIDEKTPLVKDPADVSLEDKLQRVRGLYNLAKGMDSRVLDVQVHYTEITLERALVSSHGTFARQRIPRTRIWMRVIVKENDVTDYDLFSSGGTMGFEVVENVTEQIVKETVQGALLQLSAVAPPTGPQNVIIDPGTAGIVCHESFGHGLEADQALRGRSYLKDMLGKKVASDIVTIYEDSSLKQGWGSYYFDDDGSQARKNTLVEKGMLVSFLHDIETGAAMNAQLTASSRTQNALRRRFIRMSNTYSKPGDWSIDEIVKETKKGVMMMRWQSGIEDPLGGGMQVSAKKGFLIENGTKTKPLKSITLTGRVLEVLGSVDAVSKEGFTVDPGMCGKGSEDYVPVGGGGTWWRTKGVIA
jgi:TldD protein